MPFLNLETEQRQKLFEVELVIDGQPGSMKIYTGASLSIISAETCKTFGETDACNLAVLD